MHPGKSLARLKSDLRTRIAVRRTEFAAAVQRIARPVQLAESGCARLRTLIRFWPLAAAIALNWRRKRRNRNSLRAGIYGQPRAEVQRSLGTRAIAALLSTLLDNANL